MVEQRWPFTRAGLEPQQEDLRQDRNLAEPADRRWASISLSRRHRDEAHLGRWGPQRLASCGPCERAVIGSVDP